MFTLEENTFKKSNILEVKIKNYGECGFCTEQDNQEILISHGASGANGCISPAHAGQGVGSGILGKG